MPIVSNTVPEPPEPPKQINVSAPEYRGVIVDTKLIPSDALLTRVEGSAWAVNYYSQILGSDSRLNGQDVGKNAIYQQYTLIREMELKVTSPLSTSQDNTSKSLSLVGTATVYPFLIPNEGDMFTADIGDGREGVFKVTNSERRAVFRDTCHVIEYVWIGYADEERRNDFDAKTVKTLQFVKDFLQYGQNPLVFEEDFTIMGSLQERYYDTALRYIKSFVSEEYVTLLLPGQEKPIYDHFITQAVTAILTPRETPEIRIVRKLNVSGDDSMKATNLWNVLLTRDIKLLKYSFRKFGLVLARTFEKDPMMEGIYHSGIHSVIYPRDAELSLDYGIYNRTKLVNFTSLLNKPSEVRNLSDLIKDNEYAGLTLPASPVIHPVAVDDYYVLSEHFYNNDRGKMSLLELSVMDYLEKKPLDNKRLFSLVETFHAWGALERFYYVPILLILIKTSIRSI